MRLTAPSADLTAAWAKKTGLTAGIPVAVGAFDAHLGAVGSGVAPGTLVKIIGTSTCDIAIAPNTAKAGGRSRACAASWTAACCRVISGWKPASRRWATFSTGGSITSSRGGEKCCRIEALDAAALKLKPGESGLLALDWNNGNRTILVDQRLTGLLLGQTLYTTPAEIYRALIEATAFGALTIINRFEEYGVKISAGRQLRRHRGEKRHHDADLRGCDRAGR